MHGFALGLEAGTAIGCGVGIIVTLLFLRPWRHK